MTVRAVRRPRPGPAVAALLGQAPGGVHIEELAMQIYGSRSRRSVHGVMRTVSRLRQAGMQINYDRRRRVYRLAG